MKPLSRRESFAGFLALAIPLSGCGAGSDPRTAAMSFLLAYVQKADQRGAMAYCTGDALKQLEGEARELQASRAEGFSGGPPSMTMEVEKEETPSADRRVLHYVLTPKGMEPRRIVVEVVMAAGEWKVGRFEFVK